MDCAKQLDTKGIKCKIAMILSQKYFPPIRGNTMAVNTHLYIAVQNPGTTKSWHGWGNPITARLLCPINHVAEFKANPEEYVRIFPLRFSIEGQHSAAPE